MRLFLKASLKKFLDQCLEAFLEKSAEITRGIPRVLLKKSTGNSCIISWKNPWKILSRTSGGLPRAIPERIPRRIPGFLADFLRIPMNNPNRNTWMKPMNSRGSAKRNSGRNYWSNPPDIPF